jgi:Ca-activated chloride channel homolog
VSLGAPLWFLALVPVLVGAFFVPRDLSGGLRVVAAVLLVLALVQPRIGGGDSASATLLVIDRSASIDDAQAARERAWVAEAEARGLCSKPCRVVSFAGQASFGGAAQPEATDLAGAVTLAAGALPRDGRAVVLSDGLATAGDLTAAAKVARDAGVTVDAVQLPVEQPPRDAAVTRLAAGSPLHLGDQLALQATVTSTVAARATLILSRDNREIGRQTLALRAGDNSLLLTPDPPDQGWHAYRLRVALDGDTRLANDALDATTRIGAAPTALVFGDAGSVPSLLTADGMAVSTTTSLPTTVRGYASTDVVVLGDVPADALSSAQVDALRDAVRAGAGLVVLGGPHSLSLGRYAGTELDALLPVQSLKPGGVRKRRLALELVIDRSSSMNDLSGGLDPKITLARAAAQSALKQAAEDEDELGIVAFDAQPHDVLPLQRVSAANAAAVQAQIDTLDAGGGTDVLRGLERGAQQLEGSQAPTRHMVLISDGVSEPGDPADLLARLRRENITLSTIALGRDADVALLRRLAREGKGTFLAVPDARDLPKVLAREARRVAPSVARRGELAVQAGAASPITSALSGQTLPPIGGIVLTRLRAGASAPLVSEVNSTTAPVLAQWQVGLGRVAVWTPGGGDWAATWPSERPQLFTSMARWTERGVSTPALEPSLDPADRTRAIVDPQATAGKPLPLADVQGSVRRPDDSTEDLPFDEVAPGRYAASLGSAPDAGVYGIGVAADGDEAQALLAVPYAEELRPRPASASTLGPLVEATGGKLLDVADPAALKTDDGFALWKILIGAALLTFFAAVVRSTRRAR